MKHNLSGAVAVTAMAALAASVPAAAHHSHSMFDLTTEQTISGIVKTFVFTNPHVYLYVNVDGEDGKPTTYIIEMSTVQNTMSRGITPATLKPGDNVKVKMNPLANGRPGGSYVGISKDGKEFGRGAVEQ